MSPGLFLFVCFYYRVPSSAPTVRPTNAGFLCVVNPYPIYSHNKSWISSIWTLPASPCRLLPRAVRRHARERPRQQPIFKSVLRRARKREESNGIWLRTISFWNREVPPAATKRRIETKKKKRRKRKFQWPCVRSRPPLNRLCARIAINERV